MKIYSYMDSGKAIVATNLPTHTQLLTPDVAVLAEPTPEAFGAGLALALGDAALRQRLGSAARARVSQRHTPAVYRATLRRIYENLQR